MNKFFKKKLNNGITVILEKRDLPLVSFGISNRFGGAFEDSKIKGVAHFIEHLLFTGTKNRSNEDISREIEKKGGVLNAFTSHEITSFWFKLPSEHLFSGMDIIVDMLNNPKFDKEKFDKEKKVILEEINMYHDNPLMYIYELIEKNLYDKPFGELVIGNKDSVSNLERDFVADFYEKVYSPENYVVTMVGDVDFEKVCDYIEKSFEPRGGKPEVVEIIKINKESIEERSHIDQAHFIFAIHAPLPGDDDLIALEVLDAYLANGMSSKLFLEIREKRGLAYSIRGSLDSERNYSHYLIYVGTTKENLGDVKKLILEGFDNVKNMTEKDLNEAKERLIGLRNVTSEESVGVMNKLLFSELEGDAEDYYNYEDKVNNVKLEDVKRMAIIDKYSTATIVPKG